MKRTTNLKLYKPEYSDVIDVEKLNINCDLIDGKCTTLDNSIDSHNNRLTVLENKTYPYLPLTGGTVTGDVNVTGDLLVNGDEVMLRLPLDSTDIDKGAIDVLRLDNGYMQVTITRKSANVTYLTVTFPIPFINQPSCLGGFSQNTARPVEEWGLGAGSLTNTSCVMYCGGNYNNYTLTLIGRWK